MKYMGSKNRYAKYILPFISKVLAKDKYYVEPFVGAFNMIDKISHDKRIANDSHYYLVELYKSVQKGWVPPSIITENEYTEIRNNKQNFYPNLVGFVGFGCSYAGKWFGGYARGNNNNGARRNYALESRNNILKQAQKIKEIEIFNKNYTELAIPEGSVVYCDPPYFKTTGYKTNDFDHFEFWDFCRRNIFSGNIMLISEYVAPEDFICIWSKNVNNTLEINTGNKQGTEKLFVHKSQLNLFC